MPALSLSFSSSSLLFPSFWCSLAFSLSRSLSFSHSLSLPPLSLYVYLSFFVPSEGEGIFAVLENWFERNFIFGVLCFANIGDLLNWKVSIKKKNSCGKRLQHLNFCLVDDVISSHKFIWGWVLPRYGKIRLQDHGTWLWRLWETRRLRR